MKLRKILMSVFSIGVVALVAFVATNAYFTDSETSVGNTITAGSLDLTVDNSETDTAFVAVEIDDMKPSYVRWTRTEVSNTGNNPLKLWKKIFNVTTLNNGWTSAECTEAGGVLQGSGVTQTCTNDLGLIVSKDDIDTVIVYDMYIGGTVDGVEADNWFGGENVNGTVVISEEAGLTIADIEDHYVYLGTLEPEGEKGNSIVVWQSYHMDADTTNWAQSDLMTFDIEFLGQQLNAPNPSEGIVNGGVGPQVLLLDNKNEDWLPIIDNTWGVLTWAGDGDSFDFSATLKAYGLTPSTDYALIYAPDPWPQGLPGNLITELGVGKSDVIGYLEINVEKVLGYDIPHLLDANYPTGGKIWLVLDADHDGNKMTGWNQGSYLFEYYLITYNETL